MRSLFSVINLAGLFLGFTTFLLIYLWVGTELSYDRFHQGYTNIFRITENQYDDKGKIYPVAITPGLLGPHIKNTYAEVIHSCRVAQVEFLLRHEEQAFFQLGIVADTSFFNLFSFPLVQGNLQSFNKGSDKILISEKIATAYFGQENPIGKIFQIVGRDMMVVGVLKNTPVNTHLRFDYVMPFTFLDDAGIHNTSRWDVNLYHTYVSLASSANPSDFENKIKPLIQQNNAESTTDLTIQPITEIHLKSGHLNNDMPGRGNYQYVLIFSLVAFLILVVASINYANLATARAVKRAKETGVRKAIGASRLHLIKLFLSESFIYSLLSFLLACIAVWLLLPYLNEMAGKQMDFSIFTPSILVPIGLSIIFCALLGGAYPSFFLSMLNPVFVLKGLVKTNKASIYFRHGLVIFQFVLSVSFLIGTLVVSQQLEFIQSRNLGFNKENILTMNSNRNLRTQYPEFKNELLKIPGVSFVTASNGKISFSDQSTSAVEWEGKDPNQKLLFHEFMVDPDFLKTFSIEIVEGRDFSDELVTDSNAVILNKKAIAQMGLNNPLEKSIKINETFKGNIIGIVNDFNFKSAHKLIEPVVIYIDPKKFYEISLKLTGENFSEQIRAIETVFKKFSPDRPFEFSFVDEDINKLYHDDKRTGKIFQYFAFLSIFISCLGLLGMSIFVTEQRAKEIAVRKVMGAPSLHLFWILSYEFILLVIVATLIASPLMYLLSYKWLENFAYRQPPGVMVFVIAGMVSLTVGWLTVGYRAMRVTNANPVDALRNE
jgi:putative ABC transport system permease protein